MSVLYLITVIICIILLYSVVEDSKIYHDIPFLECKPVRIIFIVLTGFIFGGIVLFLLKFILIPLIILAIIYYFVIKNKH